jgi:hypothetical protein
MGSWLRIKALVSINSVFFTTSLTLLILLVSTFLEILPYSLVRNIMMILVGLWIVYNVNNLPVFFRERNFFFFVLPLLYTVLVAVISPASGALHTGAIREILIALMLVFLGFVANISTSQIRRNLRFFVVALSIFATLIIFTMGEGFKILDLYFLSAKNQIAPLVAVGIIIIVLDLIYNKPRGIIRWLLLVSLILLILCIITLRGRASMVGALFAFFMLFLREFRFNLKTIIFSSVIFISLTILLLIYADLLEFVVKSFVANYDFSNLESLSAGRIGTYISSLEFISQHLLFGELISSNSIVAIPHNYLIHKTQLFGVLGGLGVIMIYMGLGQLVLMVFKRRYNINHYYYFPVYTLIASFVISLFEYSYPYGPGSTQFLTFLGLGFLLRQIKDVRC